MSVQSMNDLVVSIDNRGDSVIVASEERFSVELDVSAVPGLLASELELVDELHAERADEQPGSREGGDHGGVLGVSAGREGRTTSWKRGKNTSMFPSIDPHALFPVKCDFVQMYPFAQYPCCWFSR